MPTEIETFRKGRLIARPVLHPVDTGATTGVHPLQLDDRRDGLLYIPAGYTPERPSPLAVMLHGAGGNAEHGLSLIRHLADAANIILIAPVSQESSWDIISSNRFGPDIIFLNQALNQTFKRYAVDTTRLAIGGFSDGASYALSVGLTNGDLFSHIIAFSPGFAFMHEMQGEPKLFISHGTDDRVLPIDQCSRRLAPRFKKAGYDCRYHEFNGPHIVPPDVSAEAVQWFTA